MMGIGYWLIEDVVYSPDTGEVTTYNTWVCTVSQVLQIAAIHSPSIHGCSSRPTNLHLLKIFLLTSEFSC
jgi:hypothetical protein